MEKFICGLSADELKRLYLDENLTLKQMCEHMGCKSEITARKILHDNGIDTNRNQMRSLKTRKGMSDDDFKAYLIDLYENQNLSIHKIAESLGVTQGAIRRYFKKYDIPFKETGYAKTISTSGEKSGNWKGEKLLASNGYISIYMPDHPKAGSRKRVYEHRLVMEQHLGRYLTEDEVVHHINGIKTDNRLENLLLLTNSEHIALHAKLKK